MGCLEDTDAWKMFTSVKPPGNNTPQPIELPAGCQCASESQLWWVVTHAGVDFGYATVLVLFQLL